MIAQSDKIYHKSEDGKIFLEEWTSEQKMETVFTRKQREKDFCLILKIK